MKEPDMDYPHNLNYVSVADMLAMGWQQDVLHGQPPAAWTIGFGLERLELSPGRVWLLGGSPGSGKTCLVMQIVTDALISHPDLRAVIANVEMPPDALLERQLARLSGVSLSTIRRRQLTDAHAGRIAGAMETLTSIAGRLAFIGAPYHIEHIKAAASYFGCDLLVVDYIQRVQDAGGGGDKRTVINGLMSSIREFADDKHAAIVVSAVSRNKDSKGKSTYADLSLSSFRESSELEYGADDAFIITTQGNKAILNHLKSRYGETGEISMSFNGAVQRFDPAGAAKESPAEPIKIQKEIADMFDSIQAAPDGEDS